MKNYINNYLFVIFINVCIFLPIQLMSMENPWAYIEAQEQQDKQNQLVQSKQELNKLNKAIHQEEQRYGMDLGNIRGWMQRAITHIKSGEPAEAYTNQWKELYNLQGDLSPSELLSILEEEEIKLKKMQLQRRTLSRLINHLEIDLLGIKKSKRF